MILCEDVLDRLELGDGKASLPGIKRLERSENLDRRGINLCCVSHRCLLVNPIKQHVMERPLFFERQ